MDNINEYWLDKTDRMATEFEQSRLGYNKLLEKFSSDQLHYLIYWNFGYSGLSNSPETKAAMLELFRRDEEYDPEYAQLIVDKAEECY